MILGDAVLALGPAEGVMTGETKGADALRVMKGSFLGLGAIPESESGLCPGGGLDSSCCCLSSLETEVRTDWSWTAGRIDKGLKVGGRSRWERLPRVAEEGRGGEGGGDSLSTSIDNDAWTGVGSTSGFLVTTGHLNGLLSFFIAVGFSSYTDHLSIIAQNTSQFKKEIGLGKRLNVP